VACALLALPASVRAEAPPAVLRGTVVDATTQAPLAGVTVAVGRQSVRTAADGRFSLPGVPARYDVMVADPDRAAVSVYRGLGRHDVVLEHRPRRQAQERTHVGAVRGRLSGAGPFPLTGGFVDVHVFSAQLDAREYRVPGPGRTTLDPRRDGPVYGPVALRWAGPPSLSGEVVALRKLPAEAEGAAAPVAWSFARRPVTVAIGQAVTADLSFAPVPSGRIRLEIADDPRNPMRSWSCHYRWPVAGASPILVDHAQSRGRRDPLAYDIDVPDLRAAGASLCASIEAGGGVVTERCGIAPGETVALAIAPLLPLAAPADRAALTPATRFAWDAVPGPAVRRLRCEVWSSTASQPNVYVYTTEPSLPWPDLGPVGVPFPVLRPAFPEGDAAYKCAVDVLGPYATLDDAVAPGALGALAPRDRQLGMGPTTSLVAATAPAGH
jgi:hypothetical protein